MKFLLMSAGFFLFLIQSNACPYRSMSRVPRVISFSKIKNLQMGKTTSHDLQTVFGRPERVRVVNDEEEYWVYIDYQSEEWDNFSTDFLIDKKNGILKSVTWKPLSNDQFAKAENVLTSFKNMRFIPQRNPKMPEININFAESGEISFAELTKMKRVIFITLGVPNHLSLKAETALNSI